MKPPFVSIRWHRATRFVGYHCVAGPFVLELHKPQPVSAEHWLLKAYLEDSIFRCRLWAMDCVDHRAAHRTARLMAAEPDLFLQGDDLYQVHRLALQQLNRTGGAR
jgi:hypothetical protein